MLNLPLSSLPGPRAPILERTARLGLAHVEQVPDGLPHEVRVHVAHGAAGRVIPGHFQERPRAHVHPISVLLWVLAQPGQEAAAVAVDI